jgi:lipid-A-disaccharide synthase
MHLFLSVGEPSGDQHAAQLIRALRARCPQAEFSGFGGPLMDEAGFQSLYRLTDLAVMGIGSVIPHLKTFYQQYRRAKHSLREHKPDAVVLVDCPGFNWWIASAAKSLGIPVLYYMPPQLWAWAPWRIRKVRKWVDVVLAALPFEAEWYRERGIDVEYVGHPFFDEVAQHQLDQAFVQRCHYSLDGAPVRTVAILPGSRTQEVQRNFPVMLRVMRELCDWHTDLRFRVACYRESQREFCRGLLIGEFASLPIDLHVGRTPEIIAAAECCLMTSGSVSLELLARGTPAVVQYRCGPIMAAMGWLLVTCPHISLPNLIAGRRVMPEHPFVIRPEHHAAQIVRELNAWLSDRLKLEATRAELQRLREEIVRTGGVARAAEVILQRVGWPAQSTSRRAA